MKTTMESVRRILDTWQPSFGFDDINSLLELLWSSYTEHNPLYTDSMKEKVRQIQELISDLPRKDSAALFDVILELYEENEREAFLDGLRVGVRLALELNNEI